MAALLRAIGGWVGTVGAADYKSKMEAGVERLNAFFEDGFGCCTLDSDTTSACAGLCAMSLFASVLAMVTGAAAAACVDLGRDLSPRRASKEMASKL